MLLTLHERFAIPTLLPEQGNFLMMKRLRELREALPPTEAEQEEFGFEEVLDDSGEPTGRVRWKKEANDVEREVEIGESMTDLITKTLKKLDEQEKLGPQHVSLYKKFVEPGG